ALFPYTTLFRSNSGGNAIARVRWVVYSRSIQNGGTPRLDRSAGACSRPSAVAATGSVRTAAPASASASSDGCAGPPSGAASSAGVSAPKWSDGTPRAGAAMPGHVVSSGACEREGEGTAAGPKASAHDDAGSRGAGADGCGSGRDPAGSSDGSKRGSASSSAPGSPSTSVCPENAAPHGPAP